MSNSNQAMILLQLLKEIYTDRYLRTSLGLKGETAAYLFYGFPHLSLRLEFDLLEGGEYDFATAEIHDILKRHNLQGKVKVEINRNNIGNNYELKNYLGIPMLVLTKTKLFEDDKKSKNSLLTNISLYLNKLSFRI